MKKTSLTLLLSLIVISVNSNAEMSEEAKKGFLKGYYPSCLKSQRVNPVNKGLDDDLLRSYCSCTGNYVSKRVDMNVVIRYNNKIEEVYGQVLKDAGDYCIKHINEY